MPRIRFQGFASASPVALTAAQDGRTASASVPTWGEAILVAGTLADVTIDVERGAEQVAPEGIWFNANVNEHFAVGGPEGDEIYDPSFHEIHYKWIFEEASSFDTLINVPDAHKKSHIAFGKHVSHTFAEPGEYLVTLTATDRNSTVATTSLPITIGAAETAYPASRSIYVAQDRDFTGKPAAARGEQSLDGALVTLRNAPQTARVLLKRGETYTLDSLRLRDDYPNLHIGAWGEGPKPVLQALEGNDKLFWVDTDFGARDINIWGISLRGLWDATTETGTRKEAFAIGDVGAFCSFHDCDFDGFRFGLNIYNGTQPLHVIMNATTITNWQDYGIFQGLSRAATLALTGVRFTQHVDALGGGDKNRTAPYHNNHGPFRSQICKKMYMGACEFYSRNGWFNNYPGETRTVQPCIRWNQNGEPDTSVVLDRVSAEGGFRVIRLTRKNDEVTRSPGNALIDKCMLIGSHQTTAFVQVEYGGVTVRNTVMIRPNVPNKGGIYNLDAFITYSSGDVPVNVASPVFAYNNTCISLLDGINGDDILPPIASGHDGFSHDRVFIGNNVLHVPNISNPWVVDAPFATIPAFRDAQGNALPPREKGIRWSDAPILDPTYATPAETALLYLPVALSDDAAERSDALGDTYNDETALDDFFGEMRNVDYISRGALEAPD